jgi:UDP-glucose 4-epimerase
MNCLVLGGAGFLGSHLCEKLVNQGWRVRVFDRSSASKRLSTSLPIEYVTGHFTDTVLLSRALENVQVVFHLIGTPDLLAAETDPDGDFAAYVAPTVQLLELARRVEKVVYVSSGGTIYGKPRMLPIPEEHPTNPVSGLGRRNLVIENWLRRSAQRSGFEYKILRVANAYGERQPAHRRQGAVAVFVDRLMRDEAIEVWGDGQQVRDYVYAGDVADALVRAADDHSDTCVFNVGSGQGITLLDLIERLSRALGRESHVRFRPGREFDVPVSVLDVRRARDILGWEPKVSLEDAVARMADAATGEANRKALEPVTHAA